MIRTVAAMMLVTVLAGAVWAADGAALYEKRCKGCHSIGGVGGPMAKLGGPLDGIGAKHDEDWLKAYLKDPKSKDPNAKMPKMNLSDEELNALVAYMLTLKK